DSFSSAQPSIPPAAASAALQSSSPPPAPIPASASPSISRAASGLLTQPPAESCTPATAAYAGPNERWLDNEDVSDDRAWAANGHLRRHGTPDRDGNGVIAAMVGSAGDESLSFGDVPGDGAPLKPFPRTMTGAEALAQSWHMADDEVHTSLNATAAEPLEIDDHVDHALYQRLVHHFREGQQALPLHTLRLTAMLAETASVGVPAVLHRWSQHPLTTTLAALFEECLRMACAEAVSQQGQMQRVGDISQRRDAVWAVTATTETRTAACGDGTAVQCLVHGHVATRDEAQLAALQQRCEDKRLAHRDTVRSASFLVKLTALRIQQALGQIKEATLQRQHYERTLLTDPLDDRHLPTAHGHSENDELASPTARPCHVQRAGTSTQVALEQAFHFLFHLEHELQAWRPREPAQTPTRDELLAGLRVWIGELAAVVLAPEARTPLHTQHFLILHLVRTPGIGAWGAMLLQPPRVPHVAAVNNMPASAPAPTPAQGSFQIRLAHYLLALRTYLGFIDELSEQRTAVQQTQAADFAAMQTDAQWVVVADPAADAKLPSHVALSEADYLALWPQFQLAGTLEAVRQWCRRCQPSSPTQLQSWYATSRSVLVLLLDHVTLLNGLP
ncbi:hypothetical protein CAUPRSCDRAFT_12156, partial [Caulochytrium protostelioides]